MVSHRLHFERVCEISLVFHSSLQILNCVVRCVVCILQCTKRFIVLFFAKKKWPSVLSLLLQDCTSVLFFLFLGSKTFLQSKQILLISTVPARKDTLPISDTISIKVFRWNFLTYLFHCGENSCDFFTS